MVGHLATLVVGFATSVVISHVGVAELGRWRLAQAIVMYLLVLTDAGLSLLAIREVARQPAEARRYAGPVVVVRTALTLATVAAAIAIVRPGSSNASWFYLAMVLTTLPAAISLIHIVQGQQRMGLYALVRLAAGAFALGVGLLLFAISRDLVLLVIPVVVVGLGVNAALAVHLTRSHRLVLVAGPPRWWLDLLRQGAPFLVGALSIQLISNADAVIIGTSRGEAELGIYAAAYVLAGQLLFLSGPIASVVYPRLTVIAADPSRFALAVKELTGLLGLLVIPVCVGAALTAPSLVIVIYGQAYERSIVLLAVLMGMPLIGFYNVALSQALNAARSHNAVARIAVLAAAVSVLLNVALVPRFGLLAAAIVAVVTEAVTAAAYTHAVRSLAPLRAYVSALDAAAVMAAVVVGLQLVDAPLAAVVVAGMAAYGTMLLLRRPPSLSTLRRVTGI